MLNDIKSFCNKSTSKIPDKEESNQSYKTLVEDNLIISTFDDILNDYKPPIFTIDISKDENNKKLPNAENKLDADNEKEISLKINDEIINETTNEITLNNANNQIVSTFYKNTTCKYINICVNIVLLFISFFLFSFILIRMAELYTQSSKNMNQIVAYIFKIFSIFLYFLSFGLGYYYSISDFEKSRSKILVFLIISPSLFYFLWTKIFAILIEYS